MNKETKIKVRYQPAKKKDDKALPSWMDNISAKIHPTDHMSTKGNEKCLL